MAGVDGNNALEALRGELRESARLLAEAEHLTPEQRRAIGGLIAEIGSALGPEAAGSEAVLHLSQTTHELLESLRQPPAEEGWLSSVRLKMDEAIARADSDAPVVTGAVRKLVDMLANLGI